MLPSNGKKHFIFIKLVTQRLNWGVVYDREAHRVTDEERSKYPEPIEWVGTQYIVGPLIYGGGIQIQGYSRKETIEILNEILDVMKARSNQGFEDTRVYKTEISPYIKKWLKGEEKYQWGQNINGSINGVRVN